MNRSTQEARRPPANRPAGSSPLGRLLFAGRRFLDLKVHTVVRDIAPWLSLRSGSLLEVGCGDQPYRGLVSSSCRYVGLDFEGARTGFEMIGADDLVYFDGTRFPFGDGSFDSVLHTEVLEHVQDYDLFLSECRRVLRAGGEMAFTVLFQARYHFIPFDYWRFTAGGLKIILERAGFSDVDILPRGSDITIAAYKCIGVFYRLAASGILGKAIFTVFSPLVIVILAIAHASMILRLGSSDDCLGYTVFARRPTLKTVGP